MWQRLGRNTLISLIAQFVIAVGGVAAMYFNARNLGVSGLGQYVLFVSTALLLEKLLTFQSWQAVMQLGAGREANVFGAALILDFISVTIAAAIGLVGLLVLDVRGGWAAILLMAAIVFRVQDPAIGILRSYDRYISVAIVHIGQAIVTTAVAWLLWYQQAGLWAYLTAAAIIPAAVAVALFVIACRVVRPARPDRAIFRETLLFSVPAGLSGTIGALRQRGIVLLLGVFSGSTAVGIYSVADRIASVMGMVHATFFQAIFREVQTYRPISRFAFLTGLIGLIVSLAALVVTMLLGEWVLETVAGPEFRSAHWPLVLLVATFALPMAGVGIRAAIIFHIGPKYMLACNAIAILAFSAAPMFLATEGALGAAIVSLLFEGIWSAAAMFVFVRRILVPATVRGN